MKKQGLLLGMLLFGTVGITACSKQEDSLTAYSPEGNVAVESTALPQETENTVQQQTDNQAETHNLEAGGTSKEETDSKETATAGPKENQKAGQESGSKEDARKATDQPDASNKENKIEATAAPAVTEAPKKTAKPFYSVKTACPQTTKKPAVIAAPSKKPEAVKTTAPTKKPEATKKPEVTKAPVATEKPVATKTPSSGVSDSGTSNQSYASQVLKLMNEQRKANGLSALTTTSALGNAATKRAKEIVSTFSHTRPDGTSGVTVLKEYSISYNAWGENIAYGQRTPDAVMDAWMNSSGHRANILNSSFGKVGIGCYEYNGVLYWTQVFTN